jgi:CRISPR-associated protein Cas1
MTALKGRLGVDSARIPHVDRHGVVWLGRGNLIVDAGTVRFLTAGGAGLAPGSYSIPFQMLSCLVLEPGTTVSHDVLRLCASHGTGIVATGEDGVRFYASMPGGPDASARARRQAQLWADDKGRALIARRMYAIRMGEVFPAADIAVLRGIEGARAKESYRLIAQRFGVSWRGRRYDRDDPLSADIPNQALNHTSTAVKAAAEVAVAISGALPQLGFIHEASGIAFALDIADLVRDTVTVPFAFAAVKAYYAQVRTQNLPLERVARRLAGSMLRKEQVVSSMIDHIKGLLDEEDKTVNKGETGSGEPAE